MAITGLTAYKFLPKTNCAKCGYSTCLAFGMALAAAKSTIDKCPYAGEELVKMITDNLASPVKEVKLALPPFQYTLGGEKVIYRHEESFYNHPLIGISISNNIDEAAKEIEEINGVYFERAGSHLFPECIALTYQEPENLKQILKLIPENKGIFLLCSNDSQARAALNIASNRRPLLICNETPENLCRLSKEFSVPVAVGYQDYKTNKGLFSSLPVVIQLTGTLNEILALSTELRISAVTQREPTPPVIISIDSEKTDEDQILNASSLINRFAGGIIMSVRDKNKLLPLLTLRQNIFTDPRKPIRVEPGLYEYNNPSSDSPILITTNFSLTHFLVSGEAQASGIPSKVLAVDTDGTSLLTAWASDKFNAERITLAINKYVAEKESSRKIAVISAYVSGLKGEIEKKSGWNIMIGPADSSGISPWLKRNFKNQ